jgi:ribosomal RNA-processing protein 9
MSGMRNPFHSFVFIPYAFVFESGSWEGDIRIWKIDAKLNSFSLVGKIPAPGVVNSLQLLMAPKGFSKTIAWSSQAASIAEPTTKAFVLVAGLGQEHRLGRWLKIKGAVNQTLVVMAEL